ncbi:MAG: hypothetical protein IPL27_11145 [Lewinellaceae bacterium]|nr:hypothetical protein [Lewinellaceae bacterium]
MMERGTQALSNGHLMLRPMRTTPLYSIPRDAQKFSEGFVPNSINIGVDGNFAPWVGALIPDIKQEILLITEPGREEKW